MAPGKTFFAVCLSASTLCLAAGYALSGLWIGAALAAACGLAWLFARRYPLSWPPSVCLVFSVGLAVIGLLAGALPVLMICGSGFALAAWDLLLLDGALGNVSEEEQTARYNIKHLQSLALAIGAGLLAAVFGGLLRLKVPFAAMLLFVALVLFGLDRVWRAIAQRSSR